MCVATYYTCVRIWVPGDKIYIIKKISTYNYMQAASNWIYFYPKGLRDLLLYTKNKYNNPIIYINENGKYINTLHFFSLNLYWTIIIILYKRMLIYLKEYEWYLMLYTSFNIQVWMNSTMQHFQWKKPFWIFTELITIIAISSIFDQQLSK